MSSAAPSKSSALKMSQQYPPRWQSAIPTLTSSAEQGKSSAACQASAPESSAVAVAITSSCRQRAVAPRSLLFSQVSDAPARKFAITLYWSQSRLESLSLSFINSAHAISQSAREVKTRALALDLSALAHGRPQTPRDGGVSQAGKSSILPMY